MSAHPAGRSSSACSRVARFTVGVRWPTRRIRGSSADTISSTDRSTGRISDPKGHLASADVGVVRDVYQLQGSSRLQRSPTQGCGESLQHLHYLQHQPYFCEDLPCSNSDNPYRPRVRVAFCAGWSPRGIPEDGSRGVG